MGRKNLHEVSPRRPELQKLNHAFCKANSIRYGGIAFQ